MKFIILSDGTHLNASEVVTYKPDTLQPEPLEEFGPHDQHTVTPRDSVPCLYITTKAGRKYTLEGQTALDAEAVLRTLEDTR